MIKFLIIIIVIIAVPVGAFMYYRSGETMDGTIIDCQTGQRVGGAAIRARQTGWGFNPSLVWDKTYDVTSTSDANGIFSLRVPLRTPAEIKITKDNYIDSIEWRVPASQLSLKILSGNSDSFRKYPADIVYARDCAVQ